MLARRMPLQRARGAIHDVKHAAVRHEHDGTLVVRERAAPCLRVPSPCSHWTPTRSLSADGRFRRERGLSTVLENLEGCVICLSVRIRDDGRGRA